MPLAGPLARPFALALAALALLLPAAAQALLLDMDQVSLPRYTEPGAQSVQPCSYLTGATPSVLCGATGAEFGPIGYATGQQPVGDFRAAPLEAPPSLGELWSDGHRVLGSGATLVIGGLVPGGLYAVTVFSHFPVGTTLDRTIFEIHDLDPFEIGNVPTPPPGSDLFALQARTVSVPADASGAITIRYRAASAVGSGVLNGVSVIPEPGTALLLAGGLLLLGRRRRPRAGTAAGAAAILALLLGGAAAPVRAVLIDQEPANDDRFATPTALARGTSLVADFGRMRLDDTASCQELAGCDLDFVRLTGLRAGDMVLATTTVRPDLGGPEPDTVAALFDADGFLLALDGSFDPPSRLGFVVAADGDYVLGITGGGDELTFIGDHPEVGRYELSVAILPSPPAGETLTDSEPGNNSRSLTPTVITRSESPAVYAGSYSFVQNLACQQEVGPCDRDFVRVQGLRTGDRLTIATFPVGPPGGEEPFVPDTFVGVFNAAGVLLESELDLDPASLFDFLVPADGNYAIGVTGTFDDDFLGAHIESGPYKLMISVFPVPEGSPRALGAAALAALGLLAGSRRA
jgi:hypothetical protein